MTRVPQHPRAALSADDVRAFLYREARLLDDRAWDEWVDRANPPQRACIGVALAGNDLVEILITAAQG